MNKPKTRGIIAIIIGIFILIYIKQVLGIFITLLIGYFIYSRINNLKSTAKKISTTNSFELKAVQLNFNIESVSNVFRNVKNYIEGMIEKVISKALAKYMENILGDKNINDDKIVEFISKCISESISEINFNIHEKINNMNYEIKKSIQENLQKYIQNNNELDLKLSKYIDEYMKDYIEKMQDLHQVQRNTLEQVISKNISLELDKIKVVLEQNNINLSELETALSNNTKNIIDTYMDKQKRDFNENMEKLLGEVEQIKLNSENSNVEEIISKVGENYNSVFQSNVDSLVDRLKYEKLIANSNMKILKNRDIREIFEEAIKKGEKEINIMSPWMNKWVLIDSGIKDLIQKALERKVTVKIVYGIKGNGSSNGDNDRNERSKYLAENMKESFRKYGEKFKIIEGNTHSKIVLCDDKFSLIGSYNFLSFEGRYDNKDTRDETVVYHENKEVIQELRNREFNF